MKIVPHHGAEERPNWINQVDVLAVVRLVEPREPRLIPLDLRRVMQYMLIPLGVICYPIRNSTALRLRSPLATTHMHFSPLSICAPSHLVSGLRSCKGKFRIHLGHLLTGGLVSTRPGGVICSPIPNSFASPPHCKCYYRRQMRSNYDLGGLEIFRGHQLCCYTRRPPVHLCPPSSGTPENEHSLGFSAPLVRF